MELNQLRKYTSSRISIVVPCFNEEETISIFYTETLKVLKEMNIESYEEAIHFFSLLIQMNRKDLESHLYKGICLKKLKKYDDAINTLSKSISIDPKYYPAYLQRGICYTNMKIFGKAINDFIHYSKNQANGSKEITDEDFYYHRALCYINSSNIEDAINDLNKVIEINKNNSNAFFKLGFCFLLRKDKNNFTQNLENAILKFDEAIKIDSKHTEAYFNKALALTNLSKYKEAIESYNKVLELNKNDIESMYNKALILMKINKYNDAEQCIQKVIDTLNNANIDYEIYSDVKPNPTIIEVKSISSILSGSQ